MLEIRLLGRFELYHDGVPVTPTWPRRHARDILQLLALQPHFRLHKEQVIEAIWPDEDAEKRLYYVVHALRKALEPSLSQGSNSRYVSYKDEILELQNVLVDITAFEEKLGEASKTSNEKLLEKALALYRGNLLGDTLYAPWVESERERLKQRYVTALNQLADLYRGDAEATGKTLERLVVAEPSETHYRKLIVHYLQQGNPHEASLYYQRCLDTLKEVGLEPEAETKELFETLRQQQQRPPLPVNVSSFPLVTTSLFGRERELAEVSASLETSRLVTLTGVGGVGKTRLALELASSLQHTYSHGVVTVSMAALQAPELLVPALRQVLGASGDVATYLKNKHILLVLDNCEHLLGAMPTVGALLEAAPQLSVLATSRTPLHLRGETCFEVLPLDEESATDLFIARIRAAQPTFKTTSKEREDITKLCHALDDLPLAIELASSRATLDVATIRQHLHERLDFQHTEHNAPERHQSLRAALEWSYDLLLEKSQKLFTTLGVFAGRVDLHVVESIVGEKNVWTALELLLEHHLVVAVKTSEGTVFDMLETVRVYAKELFAASAEREAIQQRHAEYFLNLVIEAERNRENAKQKEYLDKLEQHYSEIRASITYSLEHQLEQGLRFIMDLGHFWYARAYYSEGKHWNLKALPLVNNDETRFGIFRGLAGLSLEEGDSQGALRYIELCLELPYVLNEPRRHAGTLSNFALLKARAEGSEGVKPLYQKVMALLGSDSTPPALAIQGNALYNLGSLLVEEAQWEEAEATLGRAMELYQAVGSQQGMAHVLSALATTAQTRGDLDVAESLATRSLELCQHLGYKSLETAMWTRLGLLALEQGQDNDALQKLKRGLELGPSVDTVTFANVLLALSAWGANHDPHWAAQLFSLAEQLENTTGKHFPNHPKSLYVLTKAQLIKDLGERGFKTTLQLGVSRKLEEVLEHLLAIQKHLPKRQQLRTRASPQTS